MPTAQQQRQKRELKRRERRAIKLHSTSLAVGHSAPLPEPPDFGLPRFTAAEQAANPGKPMTRRVKDFLRVGEWKEGFGPDGKPIFGRYDEAELKIILNNALAMMAAGDPINLGKSHGDDQMIIPTDELISPIDQVKLHNGVLWFSTYVTPAQAEYLDNPAIKVSAGMFPDYTAGNGTVYKGRTLLHVAATDRPVVGGQGPFIALANYVAVGQKPQQSMGQKIAEITGTKLYTSPMLEDGLHHHFEATDPKAAAEAAAKALGNGAEIGNENGLWTVDIEIDGQDHMFHFLPVLPKPATLNMPVSEQVSNKSVHPVTERIRKRISDFQGRRTLRLANVLPVLLASTLQGSGNMDIAALVAAINSLLEAFGLGQLPDGTDETNIVPRLEGIALAVGGSVDDTPAGDTNPNDAGDPGAAAAAAGGGGAPAMMSNLLRQVDARIAQANKPLTEAMTKLTAALTAKTGEEAETAEAKFMKFYNALGAKGVTEATLAPKLAIAKKVGWDCAILEGLHPEIKLSNLVSAAGATVEPPKEETPSGMLTDEQVAARIKSRGGKVENMPKAGV